MIITSRTPPNISKRDTVNRLDYIQTELKKTWKYILLFFCLALWGWLAIYNSTFFRSDPFFSAGKQFIWLTLSTTVLSIIAILPKKLIKRSIVPLAFFIVFCTWLVLLCGVSVNGMRGWFSYSGVYIQPSEIGKPIFAVAICYIMNSGLTENRRDLLFFSVGLLWLLPIFLQPDYGTLTVYCVTLMLAYWGLGGSVKRIFGAGLILSITAVGVIRSKHYVWIRIKTFLFPDADPLNTGWHLRQYQNSLANGGTFGNRWAHNTFTEFTLPNPQHDSIFASLGETLGFVGIGIILSVVAMLLYYSLVRAWKMNKKEESSIVYTLVTMVVFQALLHVSVTVGVFPTTGITFPLLSYGGSSLLSSMIVFGIVINIIKKE